MLKYRHILRFTEGDLYSGNFEDVASLQYEGTLPGPPSVGLVIEINEFLKFEIQVIKYIVAEQMYQTFSTIDFNDLESNHDYFERIPWLARYVKYGFTVLYTEIGSKKAIETSVKDVVI
jgi:hypothetical protein